MPLSVIEDTEMMKQLCELEISNNYNPEQPPVYLRQA